MDHDTEYARAKHRKRLWRILLALVPVLVIGILIWKFIDRDADPEPHSTQSVTEADAEPGFHTGEINGTTYYVLDHEYTGDYRVREVTFIDESSGLDPNEKGVVLLEDFSRIPEDFSLQTVLSAEAYAAWCEKWGLKPDYTDPDRAYAIVSGAEPYAGRIELQLADVRAADGTVTVYLRDRFGGSMPLSTGFVLTIPVDPSVRKLKLQPVCSAKEYENLKKYGVMHDPYETAAPEKPVIYLYPETETEIRVGLDYDGELTCAYPAYDGGWTVTAAPDGTLTDAAGKTYSYLYWEGQGRADYDFSHGFCVRGADTAAFLEQTLDELGLTRREANEFIVYWLPRMQNSAWNLIAFQNEAYTDAARLEIEPAPDTLIRVFMAWKPLDAPVELEPQILTAPARTGFTVVEWGGAELR